MVGASIVWNSFWNVHSQHSSRMKRVIVIQLYYYVAISLFYFNVLFKSPTWWWNEMWNNEMGSINESLLSITYLKRIQVWKFVYIHGTFHSKKMFWSRSNDHSWLSASCLLFSNESIFFIFYFFSCCYRCIETASLLLY